MITFEQARQIARERIGARCALVDSATLEKPYGWYFWFQSKAYLESGNMDYFLIGSGGFIVEREDGYVFEFGSGCPLEYNLASYEAGLKFETYDLTILSVSNLQQTVNLLLRLRMKFVVPERAYGEVWRIPQRYSKGQLRAALRSLPHTFAGQGFSTMLGEFQDLDRVGCCQYQLQGYRAGRIVTTFHPGRG